MGLGTVMVCSLRRICNYIKVTEEALKVFKYSMV